MSPLFAIVADVVSRTLDKAVSDDLLLGFYVGDVEGNILMVSHLLFVDDTLILCDTGLSQVLLIRMVLI